MPERRRHLSMYVPPEAAAEIEAVRRVLDPVQSQLIPAHVTLCREDELGDIESVRARLRRPPFGPLKMRFGRPLAFSGHGMLLECVGGEEQFRALREYLLAPGVIREQRPHITLAHPRNLRSVGNTPGNTSALSEVVEVTFPSVCLIEQESGAPWRVLESYGLEGDRPGGA